MIMATEKIKASETRVGDRISLNGTNKAAFTVTGVTHGTKILGFLKAVRIEVANDAGHGIAKNIGVSRSLKREIASPAPQ